MTLRWRLLTWTSGILLASLALFGLLVYSLMAKSLAGELDRSLARQASQVLRATTVETSFPFFLERVVLPDVDVFAAPDLFLQVIGTDGRVVARSQSLGDQHIPLTREAAVTAAQGESRYETLRVGGQRLRVYDSPLLLGGRPVGLLQVARPLRPIEDALVRLRWLSLGSGILALVLSAFAVGWLGRRLIGPIEEMTRGAAAIGAEQDFSRRLRNPGGRDEVARLVTSFNRMLDRLQAAYAAERRFVSDASHELRTPLTVIRGNVDWLRRRPALAGGEEAEALHDVAEEVERMQRLVDDLLALARADAGLRLDLREQDLLPILRAAVEEGALLAPRHAFEASLPEAAEVRVAADADYLRQLLRILIDNAGKFAPPGTRITLALERAPAEDGAPGWAISVCDEGPGIAAEDLPRLFDRFFRSESARATSGSGLGLAIAAWIAREHGGHLRAANRIPRGARFTLWLPDPARRTDDPM